jgi:hypothetical protein
MSYLDINPHNHFRQSPLRQVEQDDMQSNLENCKLLDAMEDMTDLTLQRGILLLNGLL